MTYPSIRVRILVATHPVDFREGHDGRSSTVQSVLRKDPFTGTVFVFRTKRLDRLKLLDSDGSGPVSAIRLERMATRWLTLPVPRRHDLLGCAPGHANCRDNFIAALDDQGLHADTAPNPLNLWMNVPVEGNSVTVTAPLSRPGDHVTFRALCDLFLVLSTCPMDVPPGSGAAPINGPDCTPMPVHYAVAR